MEQKDNNSPTGAPGNNPQIDALNNTIMQQLNERSEQMGIFLVKDGNTWLKEASLKPIPGMLFSEMWYTGELCILFADTNTGKSILAVQIADSINSTQHYSFSHNFYRAEIDPDADIPGYQDSFEDYLNQSIEQAILETGAKVLVIDNITYLRTENEKAKDASALMKHLNNLKKRYDLSILVLAHTPKRDMTQPLTMNHLQGSRMLMNFLDACFCIGVSSHDKSLRYLKQLKIRAGEMVYDAENVAICMVQKPGNFLHFSFMNYGSEREHLAEMSEKSKEAQKEQIQSLIAQGKIYDEISKVMGISPATITRILRR